MSWFVGGLNQQVEHHLFPNICHIHYQQLAPIVKRVATKHGLPYHENKSFLSALHSHYRMLKHFGKGA